MYYDVILVFVSALVVFLAAFLTLRSYLNHEKEKLVLSKKGNDTKEILMIRLQAYERMILFLERVSPQNMIMRSNTKQNSLNELYATLSSNLRAEYEHNIAQQLYISHQVWQKVLVAKETISKVINVSKEQAAADNSVISFSKYLIENYSREKKPIDEAIIALKNEAQELFKN